MHARAVQGAVGCPPLSPLACQYRSDRLTVPPPAFGEYTNSSLTISVTDWTRVVSNPIQHECIRDVIGCKTDAPPRHLLCIEAATECSPPHNAVIAHPATGKPLQYDPEIDQFLTRHLLLQTDPRLHLLARLCRPRGGKMPPLSPPACHLRSDRPVVPLLRSVSIQVSYIHRSY